MLLTIKEIELLNEKYYTTKSTNNKKILGINIETFRVINEFLEEIKLATKRKSISSTKESKPSKIRIEKYEELYPLYLKKIEDEDKLIFSKLINYITSEGGKIDSYIREEASNLPIYIDYKVEYKNQFARGTYRKDYYVGESSLMYSLVKKLAKDFNEDEHKASSIEEFMKIEAYSSYDIEFNLENIDILKEQVSSILNSTHFKTWKFKGLPDDYEREILGYIYSAKNEVSYHQERNIEVYNNINLDTCRYAACLMRFVRHSKFSNVKTLKEKTELYNKLYPYILEMVPQEDREIFAKLSNYMNFENEEYVVSGYNNFANTSKKDVLARIKLFKDIENACDEKNRRAKKSKVEHIEPKVNVYPFSYMFTGGSAIFKKEGWMVSGQDILKDILEDKTFKNWKFSGLKTIEEETHKLEYYDKLKELNFSEDSYYILGYLVNKIHEETSLNKKQDVKARLTPIVIKYIPLKEQRVFKTLLDYFTNEDEEGINVDAKFVKIDVDIINKSKKLLTGRIYSYKKNKFSQISKEEILKELTSNTYSTVKEVVNKDNLLDLVDFKYNISFSIFPNNFGEYRESHYNKYEKYNIIKGILESITETEKFEDKDLKNEIQEPEYNKVKKESKCNEVEIEVSNKHEEINLFDILESITNNTEKVCEEVVEEYKENIEIDVIEYIIEKDSECMDNLSGQLIFAI